jgi:3-methyl-2-oxobutanoate hydroxymethyltransferase
MAQPLKRITALSLQNRKNTHEKIVMLTAYDASFARLFDNAGVDVLLVGDSLGMVVQGHTNTLPVTLEDMVYHCKAVAKGAQRAHVVGDLPFMSYQVSRDQALVSAGRLIQEGGAHAVKLEGGEHYAETVRSIVSAGIPVMGHIGLTPQSVHRMGGFKVQGKDHSSARQVMRDALALEAAGCYALVLEGIPRVLAAEITQTVGIPTIGIGAGAGCDGQVLVGYDLLGMNPHFKPSFVKAYADLHNTITEACHTFMAEIKNGVFPAHEHGYDGAGIASEALNILRHSEQHEDNERVYGVPV